MRAHELAHVDRREAPEQTAPQDGEESWRDQQLRKARQRIAGELAALHREREPRADDREHARDHLAVVELGELGKARPLGEDQPDYVLAAGPVASSALWGITLLLTILNLGLLLEASSGQRPGLLLAGMLLSWIVLAVWWNTVSIALLLVPGLIVVAVFAMMILGGSLWAARRAGAQGAGTAAFDRSLYLARRARPTAAYRGRRGAMGAFV